MGLDNPLHIAFLVVALLLVFGAKRLPEIGRSLGSGMREFKDSISGASGTASADGAQPAISQTAQQPQAPVAQAPAATPQEAAQAFGAPAPEQPAPVAEPTHQP
jgi:sec-independent protein translocase protein TatA